MFLTICGRRSKTDRWIVKRAYLETVLFYFNNRPSVFSIWSTSWCYTPAWVLVFCSQYLVRHVSPVYVSDIENLWTNCRSQIRYVVVEELRRIRRHFTKKNMQIHCNQQHSVVCCKAAISVVTGGGNCPQPAPGPVLRLMQIRCVFQKKLGGGVGVEAKN